MIHMMRVPHEMLPKAVISTKFEKISFIIYCDVYSTFASRMIATKSSSDDILRPPLF
ncbi:hypothetical protein SDC9_137676 [bioreactor metagenome]|uniref:Uncharacterized protein n=1 Tax=bioreactor metagenome TaxID=1076179 RepID=A0A645DMT3_9ZZZZ